jgi:hypothetical protein
LGINGKVSGIRYRVSADTRYPFVLYFFEAAAFGVFGAVSARAVFVAAP